MMWANSTYARSIASKTSRADVACVLLLHDSDVGASSSLSFSSSFGSPTQKSTSQQMHAAYNVPLAHRYYITFGSRVGLFQFHCLLASLPPLFLLLNSLLPAVEQSGNGSYRLEDGRSVRGSWNCHGSRIWNFDGGRHWSSATPC